IWISNAGYADLLTVFAKVAIDIDGVRKERVTAFIVDAHASGVSLGKREEKMGIKASDTRAVFFDRVKVPVDDRLGDVGHGFRIALMGLQQPGERLKALGKAFKDPIRSLGAIGEYLAGRAKRTITKPSFTKVHPELDHEADLVATLVHDLALAVESAVLKHGK